MRNGDATAARQRGVAYLMFLIALAVIGGVSASTVGVSVQRTRADAEEALLQAGEEYEQALTSYRGKSANAVVGGGPKRLDDLLKDPRSPSPRRHLRDLRPDPLTGSDEWGLVYYPDGTIAGVYSLAPGTPIKQTGFQPHQAAFDKAQSYSHWVFSAKAVQQAGR
ncbi:type II secretion system protein [Rhizobacter sp. Root1221]|uniref:type II secretion system protein n=1 Tax=Rhizobacter sp. Root1221 TaxID=1736433 RepID=UPI0006FE2B1E|nr:type II secretion system protein [Rhizobacter sp. Root1221]KQV94747.1 hypothetical protein ASC87_25900 [Rhizobacter sp. Root1221]